MGYYFETKDLSVGYNGKALIHNISIGIEKGEIVTLIGPNGAGKSTILKSISKHLSTICGTVHIGSDVLGDLSYKQLSRKLSVVLTERMTPELMSCRDVVATGRYPYTGRMGILTARDERIVDKAMSAVSALDIAERSYDAISDGQRQRILLARAICQQPEIIVLDEPTSFLDIRHKLELLSVLRSMAKTENIAVIMSLHEIDLAQKISDKIICVNGDEIAYFGEPEEIFRQERIHRLYGIEKGSYNTDFGCVELPRPEGEPEVFVISGSGSGIPIFRALQKEGTPFAAGIIYENDIDLPVARALAAEVVTEKAFEPISDETFERAKALMEKCRRVIVSDFPIGACNARISRLIELGNEQNRRSDAFFGQKN